MKALWVTDSWETLDHRRDTTLRLIQESLALDHQAWWCETSGLRYQSGRVIARGRRVLGAAGDREAAGWSFTPFDDFDLSGFDAVHYRTDPPVDRRYWEPLQLLAMATTSRGPEVVNPIDVLTRYGDKLGLPSLTHVMPATVVSSSWESLLAFGRAEGRTVLKPLGGAQSHGVQLLGWSSPSEVSQARQEIAALSGNFSHPVLLQRFLAQVYDGEKRFWFVDGELIAYVRKRPREGTFVIDMDKGAACGPCTLSSGEADLAAVVGRAFREERVRLAAVDVIGGQVTDWNFTSPGMIPMMERVLDRNLARPIVQSLAKRSSSTHG